ncbi:hypothetical protein ABBQ38_000048 [Trebouxia sp. C0009 RCD-2024]
MTASQLSPVNALRSALSPERRKPSAVPRRSRSLAMQAVLIQKEIWASSKEGLDLQHQISLKLQEPVQGALTCSTAGARAASRCALRSSVDRFWQEYIRTYNRALD